MQTKPALLQRTRKLGLKGPATCTQLLTSGGFWGHSGFLKWDSHITTQSLKIPSRACEICSTLQGRAGAKWENWVWPGLPRGISKATKWLDLRAGCRTGKAWVCRKFNLSGIWRVETDCISIPFLVLAFLSVARNPGCSLRGLQGQNCCLLLFFEI